MQRRSRFQNRLRSGLSRIEVLVVICVIGLLVAMLVPASRNSRGVVRRMECQSNLKQFALATLNYASSNQGRIPHLEDGHFGWPVVLLPYLDNAALFRRLNADPKAIETEWQKSKTPLRMRVFTCPVDVSNEANHLGLSYVANSGWGRFLADSKTNAIREARPHTANVDWNRDGVVAEDERLLTRATGVFWRSHEDGFQLSLDDVAEGDGQTTTMLFAENTNARNWLSRETFDISFVVDLERIKFEPSPDVRFGLNVKSANLGPFAIQSKPRVLPGRSPVPSSHHTGILNVAFVDGRAQQVNVNINQRVYLAQMTWNGGRHGEEPKLQLEP